MNLNKYLLLGTLVAFAAGCDPYTDEPGGPANVLRVSTTAGVSSDNGGTSTLGTPAGVVAPTACDDAAGTVSVNEPVFWVTFNKTLDGASIESAPYNCQPASGWLTVTPAAPAGSAWFSCYYPSSAVAGEGASIAIFRAPVPTAPAVVDGWDLNGGLDAASGTALLSYTVTGTVKDKKGQGTALNFTVSYAPNPGAAGDPVVGTTTQTSVPLTWAAPGCNAAAEYVLERAPNAPAGTPPVDAPGAFAQVGTANIVGTSFTDTGRTANSKYWYRVTAVTRIGTTNYPGATSGEVMATTAP